MDRKRSKAKRTIPFAIVLAIFNLGADHRRVGCQADYQCEDACNKVYDTCDTKVVVNGVPLSSEHCVVVCEEARESTSQAWLACVEASSCEGDQIDAEDREQRRYHVQWCTPQLTLNPSPE